MLKPSQIRCKTIGDIWKFDIGILPSQDTDVEACIEIRQRLVILMMDMSRFHVGDIKNMRDDHVARVTKDKVRNEFRRANPLYTFGLCEEMSGRDITGAQRIQPIQRLSWRTF